MNEPNMDQTYWKFQPVMTVSNRGRLDCDRCKAVAIYLVVEEIDDQHSNLIGWCQSCWTSALVEQESQGE